MRITFKKRSEGKNYKYILLDIKIYHQAVAFNTGDTGRRRDKNRSVK